MGVAYLDSSQCARSGSRQGVTASAVASSGQGEGLACRVIEVKPSNCCCSLLYRDGSVSRGQVCGVGAAFQGVVALLGAEVAVGSRNGDVGSRVQVYR